MSPRDRWECGGSSYWDVVEQADWLKEEYGIGIRWLLVPASRRNGGKGASCWVVSVEVWTLRSKEDCRYHAQERFGYGGTWKTLPSAMLQTLITIHAKLEEKRKAAEAQAAF